MKSFWIDFIENGTNIVKALKFKGIPIVLYEKGKECFKFHREHLLEVTEGFKAIEQVIDISKSKIIE